MFCVPLVHILIVGRDGYDIVIVTQFARLCAEAEVSDRGEGERAGFEAFGPFTLAFVLDIDFQRLLLEVGKTDLGGDACGPDPAGLLS